jgi:general secretion pathway protein D
MKKIVLLLALINLTACASLMEKDERMAVRDGNHLDGKAPVVEEPAAADIPPVVLQVPIIAAPEPAEPLQTFTVVATDIPASELLFALARDARMNLDIDPTIDGRVSINAIDQTLPQILKRVSRQVALRYYVDGPNLVVARDNPFMRTYRVDYLNMTRDTDSSVGIETSLSEEGEEGGATGGSETTVTNSSSNDFWQSLETNIDALSKINGVDGQVISNRESGTISVFTSSAGHESIQRFIDTVVGSARRQVLIEATVVEVKLNDEFQAGVDWARVAEGDGWSIGQNLLSTTTSLPGLSVGPVTELSYFDSNSDRTISGAIRALDEFGDVSVMSSPKIMALNNQTSILKVADNVVYFEVDATSNVAGDSGVVTNIFNTTAKTVPVGFVMNVTPFITKDKEVLLNIRPTITRILRFVNDPNPALAAAEVVSQIPEIQVREIESVLRVSSGSTAVLGGLMSDASQKNDAGLPGLHDVEDVGVLFGTKTREFVKSELVIFLRPRIIEDANIETSLQDFKRFLKPEAFGE